MPHEINVGRLDRIIRITLGILCVGLIGYHFGFKRFLPIYLLVPVVILIPFFLKTALTRLCPIMKAMNISSLEKHG